MRHVVQVVTAIGDSIVDVAFIDDVEGAPRTSTDAPVRTRAGIADVTMTRVQRPMPCVPRASQDRRPVAYIALSLAAHLCVWCFAPSYTPGNVPGEPAGTRYFSLHAGPAVEPADAGDPGPGVGMQLPEPRAARKAASDTTSVPALDAAEIANRLAGDSAVAFGPMADGIATPSVYGVGESTFGSGRSGSVRDGDAVGWGTIGTGSYGTLGHGGDASMGWGRGSGHAMRRKGTVPTVYPCGRPGGGPNRHSCVKVVGAYDKALIRRYIQRNLDKLQFCYEKALLADPSLEGTVETEFVIAPTGRVESAMATGVSPAVSSCVEDVLRAIAFPPLPKSEESTQVHYPFTFRAAQ